MLSEQPDTGNRKRMLTGVLQVGVPVVLIAAARSLDACPDLAGLGLGRTYWVVRDETVYPLARMLEEG